MHDHQDLRMQHRRELDGPLLWLAAITIAFVLTVIGAIWVAGMFVPADAQAPAAAKTKLPTPRHAHWIDA